MRNDLLAAWHATVRKFGPRCAIVQASDGGSVTFDELDRRSREWVERHARDPAAFAGRAVVFALPNGISWLEVFLGLMRAGAVAVPVESAEPVASRRELARSLRAGFLWEDGRLTPLASPRRFRGPGTCFIKLTSGSTGQPRPLVFTARQLLADARQVTRAMGITAADSNLALIPFGHSYGMGNITLPLVAMGVRVVCGSGALPRAVLADCAKWKPTVFPGVPVLWRALAEMGGAEAGSGDSLPGVRLCIS
ncbi:MAG TPA: AMP-binding protein, partial [Opitutaceae bacterium]